MGNRAAIVMESGKGENEEYGPAVYVQWNGGPESVYAFLQELDNRKMRKNDVPYATARLIHVIGDYFDTSGITTLSLGVMNFDGKSFASIDPGDNGVYIVNRGTGKVRRFGDGKFLSVKAVAEEKKTALDTKQYKEMLEVMAKDRKGKKIEEMG